MLCSTDLWIIIGAFHQIFRAEAARGERPAPPASAALQTGSDYIMGTQLHRMVFWKLSCYPMGVGVDVFCLTQALNTSRCFLCGDQLFGCEGLQSELQQTISSQPQMVSWAFALKVQLAFVQDQPAIGGILPLRHLVKMALDCQRMPLMPGTECHMMPVPICGIRQGGWKPNLLSSGRNNLYLALACCGIVLAPKRVRVKEALGTEREWPHFRSRLPKKVRG